MLASRLEDEPSRGDHELEGSHPYGNRVYMKICRRRSSPIMDYGEQSADFIKQSQSRKEFFLTRLRFVLDRFLSYRSRCVVERPVYRIVGRTIKRALK
jgi:hypothetical protein